MSSSVVVNGDLVPSFLDDDERAAAQNTRPASAPIVAKEIALLNQLAHQGRPWFSFYTDADPPNQTLAASTYRQVYLARNAGASTEAGLTLALRNVTAFAAGQGVDVKIGATTYLNSLNYDSTASVTWPADLTALNLTSNYGMSTLPAEVIVGGVTANWPSPRAGTLWQNPSSTALATAASAIEATDVHQSGEIIATRGTNPQNSLTALTLAFRDTWLWQRPQIGWSYLAPGQFSSDGRYIDFSTAGNQYRYIFDQTVGDGGTTPSATGPAITLPMANAAAGIAVQVRVHVFVYAAMSGTTNTGTIAAAKKAASGSMEIAPTALASGPTISGTTYQWYPPLASWSASTGSYFVSYTGAAFDRVVLCAKSSGLTDTVRIGAFTFIVVPATL